MTEEREELGPALAVLRERAQALARVVAEEETARAAFHDAIVEAVDAHHSARTVAVSAGVSTQRVHQLYKRRKGVLTAAGG